MDDQIQDLQVELKSDQLAGKRIAVGVCAGIGAVEVVKIIRELRRHGASLEVFLTPQVELFITKLALDWALGKPVVKELQSGVDHLRGFDLVVVVPATLNTIAKSALGLADNAVTLLIASQLGRKAPLLFIPAMNSQLAQHPIFAEHRSRLESWGCQFFMPPLQEDRLKVPSPELVAKRVMESF